ncbi:MAG: hypothetical protein M3Q44_04905 [bacterium]|nr:hypothetical protein [bacterium]
MKNRDIKGVFVVTTAVLMIPLLAMQFTDEVDWNLFDFFIIGTLLIGTGLLIVFANRTIKNTNYRVAVVFTLVIALILTWMELSVGIFGSPFAGS